MPAARAIEREIVIFTNEQREARRLIGLDGLDRRVKRKRRVAATPAVLARHDAANAADVDIVSVPDDGAEIDTNMAGEPVWRVDQDAQIGMCPLNVSPRLVGRLARPDRVMQGFNPLPRCVSVQDVDFDAHRRGFLFPNLRCFPSLEPSIRGTVKSRLPQLSDTPHDLYASPPSL